MHDKLITPTPELLPGPPWMSRPEADLLFRDALVDSQVPLVKASITRAGVTAGTHWPRSLGAWPLSPCGPSLPWRHDPAGVRVAGGNPLLAVAAPSRPVALRGAQAIPRRHHRTPCVLTEWFGAHHITATPVGASRSWTGERLVQRLATLRIQPRHPL